MVEVALIRDSTQDIHDCRTTPRQARRGPRVPPWCPAGTLARSTRAGGAASGRPAGRMPPPAARIASGRPEGRMLLDESQAGGRGRIRPSRRTDAPLRLGASVRGHTLAAPAAPRPLRGSRRSPPRCPRACCRRKPSTKRHPRPLAPWRRWCRPPQRAKPRDGLAGIGLVGRRRSGGRPQVRPLVRPRAQAPAAAAAPALAQGWAPAGWRLPWRPACARAAAAQAQGSPALRRVLAQAWAPGALAWAWALGLSSAPARVALALARAQELWARARVRPRAPVCALALAQGPEVRQQRPEKPAQRPALLRACWAARHGGQPAR